MSEKDSRLKTRPPTASFLADTKPPALARKTAKARSWHRPDEDRVEEPEVAPKAAPESFPEVKAAERSPVSASPPRQPPDEPPRSKSPEALPAAPAAQVAVAAPKNDAQAKRSEAPKLQEQVRQGASITTVERDALTGPTNKAAPNESAVFPQNLTGRANALISRAQVGCPHEYLFRQIMMFEMSTIDETGEFGLLSLSRNGLEQLFGISEGGVKKAKKEMEAYNLIATVSVGTRASPTVFKVFSPWTSSKHV